MDNNRKRKIVFWLVSAFVVIVVGLGIWSIGHKRPSTARADTEAAPITLQNFQPLYNLLLPEQYNAVYYDLSLFLQKQVSPGVESAVLSNLVNAPNGTLTFTITVKQPSQTFFTESVNRETWDTITISIPKYNYTKTIKVY